MANGLEKANNPTFVVLFALRPTEEPFLFTFVLTQNGWSAHSFPLSAAECRAPSVPNPMPFGCLPVRPFHTDYVPLPMGWVGWLVFTC